jgi:hypothetical protein
MDIRSAWLSSLFSVVEQARARVDGFACTLDRMIMHRSERTGG